MHANVYRRIMGKTIQIRDVPDETYQRLVKRAAETGQSVPDLLRKEVERLASRLSTREWLDRAERMGGPTGNSDTVALLNDARGPWPT